MRPAFVFGRVHPGPLLVAGHRLASQKIAGPSWRAAAWAVFAEMHESLARLPDHERRWLTAGDRAHWPDIRRSYWENQMAADGGHVRCWGEPSRGAFDRMQAMIGVVIALPPRRHRVRDMRIAEALARGCGGGRLQRLTGMDRRRIADVKARVSGELAAALGG